ncbi:hypothetical protein [Streptomyces sp. 891-h]|uniref:hypothetical protein n=1 Tax=Streptomyces sp. 891-h TaxID=2720714 RepID=UPI001FAAD397|nr:hypothetical protein [Streptomyces sp. 891-h]UNZ21295.1 hypothetical protein HC362_33705 [Streptomyces sp. 891-h]
MEGGDDFQDSKSTVSLDQTQVRRYRAWKRRITMAMAALALLAVLAAIDKTSHPVPILATAQRRRASGPRATTTQSRFGTRTVAAPESACAPGLAICGDSEGDS